MRAFLAAVACCVLLGRGAPLAAAPPDGDARRNELAQTFLHESEVRDPLFADRIGVHAYDDRLPDYSAAGLAARDRWLRAWRVRVSGLSAAGLTRGGQADRTALLDTMDLELFENRTLRPWATNPDQYVEALGDALYTLTGRHYAPADVRFSYVARRLEGISALVDAAIANLRRPARTATQFAIEQNAGNLSMYRDELPVDVEAASPRVRSAVMRGLPAAVASLARLQRFLSGPLLARSDGNPRVGAAVFDRELVLADGTDVPRPLLLARARGAIRAQRADMLRLALPLDRAFFPGASRDRRDPASVDRIVRRVLDRLAEDHPARDGVFATAKADVASLEAFLTATPIVPLPVPNTLQVVPTPPYMAGFAGASMDTAGPFTPLAESYFYIDKIPPEWSAARVASYLREYNAYEMKMLSMHEAVPGHYVQFRYNNTLASIVRRIFGNGAFVEGWAVYTEGMMLDAGYGAGDPRLRLFQLKWRLREEGNAIIDAEYHAGSLTKSQCVAFLQNETFAEHAEALTKWHRLAVSHDQLSSYFVGLDAITRARNDSRARFSLAAFNRRLLAIGDVEPRFIRGLL